jgi:hypothetical protein
VHKCVQYIYVFGVSTVKLLRHGQTLFLIKSHACPSTQTTRITFFVASNQDKGAKNGEEPLWKAALRHSVVDIAKGLREDD